MLDLRLPLLKLLLLLLPPGPYSIHPSIHPTVLPSPATRYSKVFRSLTTIPPHPVKLPLTIIIIIVLVVVVVILVLFIVVVVVGVSCVLFMPGMQPTVSHSVQVPRRLRWHSFLLLPPRIDHRSPAAGFATHAHTQVKNSLSTRRVYHKCQTKIVNDHVYTY